MADLLIQGMSNDELMTFLKKEGDLYLRYCGKLMNGSNQISPQNMNLFKKATKEYVDLTEPYRTELNDRFER